MSQEGTSIPRSQRLISIGRGAGSGETAHLHIIAASVFQDFFPLGLVTVRHTADAEDHSTQENGKPPHCFTPRRINGMILLTGKHQVSRRIAELVDAWKTAARRRLSIARHDSDAWHPCTASSDANRILIWPALIRNPDQAVKHRMYKADPHFLGNLLMLPIRIERVEIIYRVNNLQENPFSKSPRTLNQKMLAAMDPSGRLEVQLFFDMTQSVPRAGKPASAPVFLVQ
jgi:hypothetical protein